MKTPLSAKSVAWLYISALLGGLAGLGVALFVLSWLRPKGFVDPTILTAVGTVAVLAAGVLGYTRWREWHQLKVVSVDEQFLYVSDYRGAREVAVPLSEIDRVTQWRGKGIRPVRVHFRSTSRFGGSIRFQPLRKKGEFHLAIYEDDVVKDLRALIGNRGP